MSYNKLLRNIFADSKFTQKQLADKCNITRSYVGNLLHNITPVPDEEISRAIARACNVDERLLVIEGYLDKAPKEIKETFVTLKYLTMLSSLTMLENSIDKETLEDIKKEYETQPLSNFVIELMDKGQVMIDIKNKGYELIAEEDNLIFRLTQPPAIKIADNSMSPLIKENDEVTIEIKNKYEDSDILIVKFTNEENITVRQAIFLGNDIKLVPLNNKYKSKLVHISDIKILGKVKKVITEI